MSESLLPINILVVGSEHGLFDGVLDALPTVAAYWSVRFADNAAAAMAELEADDTIDAVVVHERLSDASGAKVLEAVRSAHPQVARVLVVGERSFGASKGVDGVAHEVIESPIDVMKFVSAVSLSSGLQQRIGDPALHKLLSDIDVLPSPSKSVIELNAALDRSDVDVSEIAKVVEADVAVTAKLLRLVNSAYFGLSNDISDTTQAIAYLGLPAVRTLVGSLELLNSLGSGHPDVAASIEDLQAHSLGVADLARGFMTNKQAAQDAYVAGMLHDVGLLALVSCAPIRYMALKEEVLHSGRTLEECELDVIGSTHATVGAYVLGLWGFPSWLVEAVAHSHDADSLPEWTLDRTSAVFLAEQIVNLRGATPSWEGGRLPAPHYVESLGLPFAVIQGLATSETGFDFDANVLARTPRS